MARRITIEERPNRRAMCETKMRYAVMFDGKEFSELYWNMRGYRGSLPSPQPDGSVIHREIGEVGISTWRREAAQLNREIH